MVGIEDKGHKLEVKEFIDGERRIIAYASIYNNYDMAGDKVLPGAFDKTVRENGPQGKDRIKLISQHNKAKPVGRITKMYSDQKGLIIEAIFGEHADGEDHYRMAKEGILTELSIGYQALNFEKNDEGGRDLKEIALWEVSLVTIALNDEAKVIEVKSVDALEDRFNGLSKLLKKMDDTELSYRIIKEVLRIKSAFPETTTQPDLDLAVEEKSVEPEVEVKETYIETLHKGWFAND